MGLADDVLQALRQACASQADIAKTYWLRQSEDDVAKTRWLERQFSFGRALYVVDGRARLRPGIIQDTAQDTAQDTFEFEGMSFNKPVSLYLANKALEQLHEQWANGVGSEIKTHKEQTMNLTQKASAFLAT